MAILLAETLISLGAAVQRWRQGQEAWVPFTDAITLQPAVVPVVAIGVIETLPYSCCQWIGVDIPLTPGISGLREVLVGQGKAWEWLWWCLAWRVL